MPQRVIIFTQDELDEMDRQEWDNVHENARDIFRKMARNMEPAEILLVTCALRKALLNDIESFNPIAEVVEDIANELSSYAKSKHDNPFIDTVFSER